jgi:8-oxo-dGTP diphosphatase
MLQAGCTVDAVLKLALDCAVMINKLTTSHSFWLRVARFVRKNPGLMRVFHSGYRVLQAKYSIGVVGVVFNDENKILLAEHVFHPISPWGLPGGWLNTNEQPSHGVQREILEELSLTVTVDMVLLSEISYPYHLDIAFLCHPIGEVGTLSSELLAYDWVDPSSLPKLVRFHQRAVDRALQVYDKFNPRNKDYGNNI